MHCRSACYENDSFSLRFISYNIAPAILPKDSPYRTPAPSTIVSRSHPLFELLHDDGLVVLVASSAGLASPQNSHTNIYIGRGGGPFRSRATIEPFRKDLHFLNIRIRCTFCKSCNFACVSFSPPRERPLCEIYPELWPGLFTYARSV